MNRPEKKYEQCGTDYYRLVGYNQACDDWEEWLSKQSYLWQKGDNVALVMDNLLPSEEEIAEIAWDMIQCFLQEHGNIRNEDQLEELLCGVDDKLSKAIHKRIMGEK